MTLQIIEIAPTFPGYDEVFALDEAPANGDRARG